MSCRQRAAALAISVLTLVGVIQPARAQERDTVRTIVSAAAAIYNAERTRRVTGEFALPADSTIRGDVAVLNGPVRVAGRIFGTLVAINADVHLRAGASLGGLIVVGGAVTGRDSATMLGEVLRQPELLRYHISDGMLMPEAEPTYDEAWWKRRARARPQPPEDRSWRDLTFTSAHTYNRVEGLPIMFGPRVHQVTDWGRIGLDAYGIVRTAGPVRWDRGTLGYDATSEVQLGRTLGAGIGGRLFDVVEAVEPWQRSDAEAGFAAFFARRDYRDFYRRHGALGFMKLHAGRDADLTFSLGNERWERAIERHPISLFRSNVPWRPNPAMDEGRMQLASTLLRVDTRNRSNVLWGGWYVDAQTERGVGTLRRDPGNSALVARPEHVNYTRGFLDLRRYNRLSPGASLNLRFVAGGWMSGDRLPLQRRLSLGGTTTLPGYDFREPIPASGPDVLTCGGSALPGSPALCDRMMLMQVEYRARFHVAWVRDDARDDWWRLGLNRTAAWVLFADAGRGWNVGAPGLATNFAKDALPPLSSFRTDVGAGIDFGSVGIYVAKATSAPGEPVNIFVKSRHRF